VAALERRDNAVGIQPRFHPAKPEFKRSYRKNRNAEEITR
jgi:hypothetical protein